MAITLQTPAQRRTRHLMNGISKTWKINRSSRRPRGFQNILNNCYRHATLQTLLHLPRFLTWIRQHNAPRRDWPCNHNHSQFLRLYEPKDDNPVLKEAIDNLRGECVPCLLKNLVVAYWGRDYKMKNEELLTRAGEPPVFLHRHPTMDPIHRIAERYFCRNPDNLQDTLNSSENKHKSKAQKQAITQEERRRNMTAQQDADEFMIQILGSGCEESFVPK